jgi:hypothetical protein
MRVQAHNKWVTGAQRTESHIEQPLTIDLVEGCHRIETRSSNATEPGHARRSTALSPPAENFAAVDGENSLEDGRLDGGFQIPHASIGEEGMRPSFVRTE